MNPFPIGLPYGASKAAVNNLTNSLAAAWTPHGVRVNAVAAGGVRTELLVEDALRNGIDPATIGAGNGMGRLAEPYEIATAALFLASDASSFCSGSDPLRRRRPEGCRHVTSRLDSAPSARGGTTSTDHPP